MIHEHLFSAILSALHNVSGIKLSGESIIQKVLFDKIMSNNYFFNIEDESTYVTFIQSLHNSLSDFINKHVEYKIQEVELCKTHYSFCLKRYGNPEIFLDITLSDDIMGKRITFDNNTYNIVPSNEEILADTLINIFIYNNKLEEYLIYFCNSYKSYNLNGVFEVLDYKYPGITKEHFKNIPQFDKQKYSQCLTELVLNDVEYNLENTIINFNNFYNEIISEL